MHPQHTLNIGILAHVDAGKTSLTERLLFDTGVIDRLGSVDAGSTQTDTGAIERQRGITVRSAVASFRVGPVQVNLIDTPGHSDFIAEVERALGVLDGAILVLSAVEGVQAQTRILMRTLRELRLPTLIFVNKIDRAGASRDRVLAEIRRHLAPHIVPMTLMQDLGTTSALAYPEPLDDPAFRTRAAEVLAETDDTLLTRLLEGWTPSPGKLMELLADRTAQGLVHPVYFGSALGGQGVGPLIEGITALLPAACTADGSPPADQPARGTVFAVERGPSGAKSAYLRLFSGTLALRQRVTLHRRGPDGTPEEYTGQITGLEVVGQAGARTGGRLTEGNIARIRGLPGIRVGDRLGGAADPGDKGRPPHFAPPTLRTVVRPRETGTGPAARLYAALCSLAEQDPLIHACTEPGGATSVLLYGEIQKQIIAATLEQDFGIEAVFEPSRIVCTERPTGVGEACAEMGRGGPSEGGFWATIGLRVEPAARGTGALFRYETELGALPHAFHRAIEETVHSALRHGPHGWAVTDCVVTLVRSGFLGPASTAGDFRGLTPLVLTEALRRAGTQVYEPYHAYELEIPLDVLAPVTQCLGALGAEITRTSGGTTGWLLAGEIPAVKLPEAERLLPGLSRGEGVWWSRLCGDRPIGGPPPSGPTR
ncbi:tetracycline resistance ribosomal protection protein Otr(A) [Peterkaempfera sp. SMS 1(5)a]|uniref:tetracycline resistance ribosomal protection protein Otr(A) n=1 Tax=Peterkaempfera podocarpi TaxID=3232308 RepID=UPI0036722DE7